VKHPRDERGDMVVGWLARIVLVLTVVAVLGYDGITMVQAQITVRDQASSAATSGAQNFATTHSVQAAYQAALADARGANSTDTIAPADFVVAKDGTVTLKLSRPVHTLVAHYLPISSATLATATGVARQSP